MFVPLILGSFIFDETGLEVPEAFGDVAGVQTTAQHDFPGGVRTHQTFGYLPSELRWRARFSGNVASDRVEALKRILVAGQEVTLSYGERAWLGRLVKFAPTARHSWLFEYDLEFWPRQDISSGAPQPQGWQGIIELMQLRALSIQSMINGGISGALYENIALIVAGPVGALVGAVQAGILAATGNTLAAADQLAITAAAATALAVCVPLTLSADPTISSPASDLAAYITLLGTLATASDAPRWQVGAINPNLMLLAAQYYGDATQWQRIASYNGLSDPQPIGTFQLLIPPPQ